MRSREVAAGAEKELRRAGVIRDRSGEASMRHSKFDTEMICPVVK